ncbi:MAG: hypothetical protein IKU42_03035 [Oscillospiraceae bacterium]|nr:hypothetical protein [Oscillospiraceae bacterium]
MKKNNKYPSCDEICGKEMEDYVGEFSPHRLSLIRYEEDSEEIFDTDEENCSFLKVMKM